MKNIENKSHIEGLLYQHSLELKESGPNSKNPGTQFISGTIEVATDDALTNIVPVHFTYVTAVTSTGKVNRSFNTLINIIEGAIPNVMANGKDNAATIRIDSAIGLNEFYSDRNGKDELVSVKRNEGGFIHVGGALDPDETKRNTFSCDMVITNCSREEADPERNLPEKAIISGVIFDFRGSILPVSFSAVDPAAMAYFEGLGASSKEPVFTKIWGNQISETIVKTYVTESAFGADSVRQVPSTRKDYVITGAAKEVYVWDDAETLTAQELMQKMTERETYLATIKQRQDEYNASKKAPAAAASAPANAIGAIGNFNF